MKECRECKKIKALNEFSKNKTRKDGVQSECKVCRKAYDEAYREANRERRREQQRSYIKTNKNKRKAYQKANNNKYSAYNAKRRAKKLQATPHWLTEYQYKQIELKYWISNFLTEYTGIQHHVDHIHPLQGKNICGLHVPDNLQVLTAEENLSKNNSHEA